MRRESRAYILALSLALGAASNISGQERTFTTIDFPGASYTFAWGINPRGDIVGEYGIGVKSHGFLLSGGSYTSIDFPDADSTFAVGINARGDIVGGYVSAGDGVFHGFLLSGGSYTSIDFPGAISSFANGIGPQGDIVGDYSLTSKVDCCAPGTHGFLLSGGQFTTIDVPGSTFGYASGINPGGEIVGSDVIGVPLAYLLSRGNYITIDARTQFPGATFTNGRGINPQGDVVGRYVVGGKSHGYVWSAGQFTTLDGPGAIFTGAGGINPEGDIVGRYRSADRVFHGFLWSKGPEVNEQK